MNLQQPGTIEKILSRMIIYLYHNYICTDI